MLLNSAANLAAERAITLAGELGDGLGKLGLDSGADVNQMRVDRVVHVYLGSSARESTDPQPTQVGIVGIGRL